LSAAQALVPIALEPTKASNAAIERRRLVSLCE
jgi:hypothetical protein